MVRLHNTERFERRTDVPEDFFPEDLVGKHLPIADIAERTGASSKYNKSTGVWTLEFGDEVSRKRGSAPYVKIEPNADYDIKKGGKFLPNLTYNSGDNRVSLEIKDAGSIGVSGDGYFNAIGIISSGKVLLQVSPAGVPRLIPVESPA